MFDDDASDDPDNPYPPGTEGPRVEIPSVDVPSVNVPSPDSAADNAGDSKLASLFLFHVILWNAVLLLLSLGAMLIYFRADWDTGGQLVAAGVVLSVYGVYRLPDGTSE
ncbi:DUF7322 domain-containing protein [Halopelagius fulvigenes]|uniref:DUF7322 domain-containing protein n=1 Tax=Halopelagius fulvigenes TaxID=1198324 RepID=A0ABD5U178_9EURY